jgi:diacylglycerol kinase (ATP)
MRICLFWNETAGAGISHHDLLALLERSGHSVVRTVDDVADLPDMNVDCVVAAGGDGTVARAARALAGEALPLAILPLGTANNIANSLGLSGSVEQLVSRWHQEQVAAIDLGVITCGKTRSYFIESVGCGLAASCIEEGRATLSKDDPDTHLEHALDLYVETLRRIPTRRYAIKLDDEEIAGEFLLVEVLNTPSIGPQLAFAADANIADGFFSVVAASESDRASIAAYVAAARNLTAANAGLRSWRARKIEITGADRFHIDDRVTAAEGASIQIEIHPAALSILA